MALAGCATRAATKSTRAASRSPGELPDRGEFIVKNAHVLTMDPPLGDPVQAIVRSAQPHNVDTVVVDGRILKRGGQMTALDVEKVVRESSESLVGLRARTAV